MKTFKSISVLLLCCFLGLGAALAQSPAQNKATALKILAAVDAGNLETFSMYVSPALVEHMPFPPGTPGGTDFERTKNMIAGYHAAFPDGKTTVQKAVAEGDMVILYSRYAGTNTGALMGMPATNKSVDIDQVDIIRFDASGKGVEHWAVIDQLTMMQQLGVIPTEGH